jgi:hypothetical protein
MKKILLLMMLTLSTAIASQAQITLISSVDGTVTDTLSDASTMYFTTPINALANSQSNVYRIQFTNANISGTSTFKAIYQSTIDGTNWTNMHQVAGTTGIACDTLQVTSASPASFIFASMPSTTTNAGKAKRIRIKFVGTGTQKTYISGVQAYAVED